MLSSGWRRLPAMFALLALLPGTRSALAQPAARQAAPAVQPPAPQTPSPAIADARPAGRTALRWWKDEAFKKDLGLTNDQSTRIENIFQATLPQLRQGYDELDRLENKLSHLLETDTDEALIVREVDKIEAARSRLNKTRTLMHVHMRQLLTAEQRVRFVALFEGREQDEQKPRAAKRP